MKMKQCPQGHMYDLDVNRTCPICAGGASTVAFNTNGFSPDNIGATMPLNYGQVGGFAAQSVGVTMPVAARSDFQIEDTGHTMPLHGFSTGTDDVNEEVRPVCGWLVCVEGAKKGRSYEIYTGYTSVGRAAGNDIVLDFDETISENMISLSYDPDENAFGISIVKTKNIVKIDDKTLHVAGELQDGSILKLGNSKFVFRALCNANFQWNFD